jgi:hypothetical protein
LAFRFACALAARSAAMVVLVLLKSGTGRSRRISSFVHKVTDTHIVFFSDLAAAFHHRIHSGSIVDRCFAATIT